MELKNDEIDFSQINKKTHLQEPFSKLSSRINADLAQSWISLFHFKALKALINLLFFSMSWKYLEIAYHMALP